MTTAAGRLTTHVLDTMHGRPGAGLRLELFRLEGDRRKLLLEARTNDDGRVGVPLLEANAVRPGIYELVFHVGEYFRQAGAVLSDPPFLDAVPIRFGIASATDHYHVPLLIAPYGYSTYRGS